MSASASVSLRTDTTISASRVNRGSVRAETARPPTSANETSASVRRAQIWRSVLSSAVTQTLSSHRQAGRGNRQLRRPASRAATTEGARRCRRQSPADGAAEGSGASNRCPIGTDPAWREMLEQRRSCRYCTVSERAQQVPRRNETLTGLTNSVALAPSRLFNRSARAALLV